MGTSKDLAKLGAIKLGAIELALVAGGFILGLAVGRWWAVLIPVLFGACIMVLFSADPELDSVKGGLFLGGISTVGAVIGVLLPQRGAGGRGLARRPPGWFRSEVVAGAHR